VFLSPLPDHVACAILAHRFHAAKSKNSKTLFSEAPLPFGFGNKDSP